MVVDKSPSRVSFFLFAAPAIGRLQKGRGDKQNDRGVHGGENAKRRRRSVA